MTDHSLGFLALYDPNVIRAGRPTKEVYGFDRMATDTTGWFTERIAAGELASDRVMYGRFHTFARKIDGRWRIVVDDDTARF